MNILGIGGILDDAAAALAVGGRLAAAIEQFKLARRKRPGELPEEAIQECLAIGGVRPEQIDCVAVVRPLESGRDSAIHLRLRSLFPASRVILVEHHTAHAASAFFASPFEQATVLTADRHGDSRCAALWRASGKELTLESESYYPDSLADLYSRVTELLGMQPDADEHKVQWLSARGDERFTPLFEAILGGTAPGFPRMDRSFFNAERVAVGGFSSKFFRALSLEPGVAVPDELRAHVARGLQHAVESAVIRCVGTGENLCVAGGLAMNAMLIAALEGSGAYSRVFVQPAAGNAGTALGAVYHAAHQVYGQSERLSMGNLCLGPEFGAEAIKEVLENCKLSFRYLFTTDEVIEQALAQLNEDRIVAWMHGRMEFGPRALGNRSLLASPLNPYSTENLNAYIKRREPYRKFAASVPAERAHEFFETGENARFLATVSKVRPAYRERFAAAVLAGDWVRVHTVRREDNALYWRLLHAQGEATGLPVLYNTSFNLFGDPLVCGPRDAVRSFYSSGVDAMLVGNFFLQK